MTKMSPCLTVRLTCVPVWSLTSSHSWHERVFTLLVCKMHIAHLHLSTCWQWCTTSNWTYMKKGHYHWSKSRMHQNHPRLDWGADPITCRRALELFHTKSSICEIFSVRNGILLNCVPSFGALTSALSEMFLRGAHLCPQTINPLSPIWIHMSLHKMLRIVAFKDTKRLEILLVYCVIGIPLKKN